MTMSIRTNVASLDAQRNLEANQTDLGQALNHLSSGYRITSAADDAAGLAISENLRSQVTGSNQAARNAQDGISMVQTAEGGMNEQTAMLQRMRELAVQGANDTLSGSDRSNINAELQQLMSEFNGTSARTKFNGQSLLTGALSTTLATGGAAGTAAVGGQLNTTGGNSSISNIEVAGAKAGQTYTFSSSAAGTLTLTRASDSVAQTVNLAAIAANGTSNISFAQLGVSIGVGADAGGKTAAGLATDLSTKTVVTAAASSGSSAQLQIGADSADAINISFSKVAIDSTTTGFTALNTALTTFNTNSSTNSATATDSNNLMNALDTAISQISTSQANLGAVQNRLGHAVSNLQVTSENLTQSQSRIRDVNMASETARMTSDQVLSQAGVSVLAQANQMPQLALKLLG